MIMGEGMSSQHTERGTEPTLDPKTFPWNAPQEGGYTTFDWKQWYRCVRFNEFGMGDIALHVQLLHMFERIASLDNDLPARLLEAACRWGVHVEEGKPTITLTFPTGIRYGVQVVRLPDTDPDPFWEPEWRFISGTHEDGERLQAEVCVPPGDITYTRSEDATSVRRSDLPTPLSDGESTVLDGE